MHREQYEDRPKNPQDIIDPAQLKRIESVHRGFFYQHLFAVGCLFRLAGQEAGTIHVERDEDIEIDTGKKTIYVQVKNRTAPLRRTDIESTLARFNTIRSRRQRKEFQFLIASSSELSHQLAREIGSSKWPHEVIVQTPATCNSFPDDAPPSWPTVRDALAWCITAASDLPFSSLRPDTLVWKLAGRIQFVATGEDDVYRDHSFARAELPALFEQLVEQLQEFPSPPVKYRPQTDEPSLLSDARTRLIIGFPGAGKTAWASWHAQLSSAPSVYFDVGDLPGGAIANSLARELLARFLTGTADHPALLPSSAGVEALRYLNKHINIEEAPIVVLDNVHRIEPDAIRNVVDACSTIRFILLARPSPDANRLASFMGIEAESLDGWDVDTISAVFATEGASINPGTADQARITTGGLPLYVLDSARLCMKHHKGDAAALFEALSKGDYLNEPAQESILRMTIEDLSPHEVPFVAAMSVVNLRLSAPEIEALADVLSPRPHRPASIFRSLRRKGIVQIYENNDVKLHDALRIPASNLLSRYTSSQLRTLDIRQRDILFASMSEKKDLARYGAWLRLLGPTGQVETLVNLATMESFHEIGEPSELKDILIATADDETIDDRLRYWTLDALAYWEFQEDEQNRNIEPYLYRLSELLARNPLGPREQTAFLIKRMLYAGMQRDIAAIGTAAHAARSLSDPDNLMSRIVRYNHAVALFHGDAIQDALEFAQEVCMEYYEHLNLDPMDVIGADNQKIISLLSGAVEDHKEDLKRLADCLDLSARCLRKLVRSPRLTAIHAVKFYHASGSYRSAMRTAQDVADDLVEIGDAIEARQMMENNVLPLLRHFGFNASSVDVRGQYAVILAYCGEYVSARSEMHSLTPYVRNLPASYQVGFAKQHNLIEQIAGGRVRLRPLPISERVSADAPSLAVRKQRVGRNALCPCGSGRKYKRCCGR